MSKTYELRILYHDNARDVYTFSGRTFIHEIVKDAQKIVDYRGWPGILYELGKDDPLATLHPGRGDHVSN